MNMQQLTIDAQIDAVHKAASQAEEDAQGIIDRLKKIPGCEALIRARRGFGEVPNPWLTGNITQQAAILKADAPLGTFLARKAGKAVPGADPARLEAEQRKQQSIERMQAATAAMAERNKARRQQQVREATYGRWDPLRMKVI